MYASFYLVASMAAAVLVSAAPVVEVQSIQERVPLPQPLLFRRAAITVSTDNDTASQAPSSGISVQSTPSTPGEGGTNIADAVGSIITSILNVVDKLTSKDLERRGALTKQTVADVKTSFPSEAVVVSNVGYSFTGTLDSKNSIIYNAILGADVSFDVITFKSGTFVLQGDGGFQNWAYSLLSGCTANGKTLTCP